MPPHTAVLARHSSKHEVRVRRFFLAAAAYGVCIPLLGIAHALGILPLTSVLQIAGLMIVANAAIYSLFATGLNERFADPSLTWLQTVTATLVLMVAVYHCDRERGLALMMCLVVLSFGTFRFTTREFFTAAGMVLAGYAAVINVLMWNKPDDIDVWTEAFRWLTLAFVLPSFALVGGRLSDLRQRVRRTNDELSSALSTIQRMATHDTLTGLPNRALFNETLAHAIARAQRHSSRLAIFFLDLDRFKNINDTLGHGVGDRVLQEAARRLIASVRASDLMARLGGDEFVLLVEDFEGTSDLADIAAKVVAAFEPTTTIDGHELALSASVGICAFPEDGRDAQELLSNADIAMYRAKEQGRNRFCFYAAELNQLSEERLALEAGLRHALERGEIEIFYQPKIEFRTGRVTGVEALIRWRHPTLGLLMPDRFISLAEENGVIIPIGYWTLRRVCERARRWHDDGLHLSMAVNLSASQFHQPELVAELAAILKTTGLAPDALELEITESMVMKDPERAVRIMEALRAMGVRLSIDDFGTGHSSLGYLKRFPINQLKVDRTFVRDLPHNGDDIAITRAVIAMAHSLKMSVVAEGVEHQQQFDLLRAEGCDEFQGYFCRPPLEEGELMRFLVEERASRGLAARRPLLAT
ncbi:MAG TPA: EAL domain-containing protein [Usitatibacter sp.]|jgi:diguanylate cyclase (GGDEF)-like protein|nr:EAL domain-containing protein [Usitatibacter sp.]